MNGYAIKSGDTVVYSANKTTNSNYATWKTSKETQGYTVVEAAMGGVPSALKYVAGSIVDKTTNELYTESIPERKSALYNAVNSYVDTLLNEKGFSACLNGTVLPNPSSKAQSVVDWYNVIFDDYYTRVDAIDGNTAYDLDFSSHGGLPFAFRDVKTEIKTLNP